MRKKVLNRLVLVMGVLALALPQIKAAEVASPVQEQLQAARRSIIWSSPSHDVTVGDSTDKEYGYSGALNVETCGSYADLLVAVAGADGELGQLEEEYIRERMDILAGNRVNAADKTAIMDHVTEAAERLRAGGYRDTDILSLIDAHVRNAKKLGNTDDIGAPSAIAVLFDSIMTSYADGLAPEEREAAKVVAKKFNISDAVFNFIDKCCNYRTLLNRYRLHDNPVFGDDVAKFAESVRQHYAK